MNVKDWDTQVELARTAVETAFQVADEMADRIEQLEERLTAATDDAKEAEAYAEELEARNKELTLQLLATSGQAADALDKLVKAKEALRETTQILSVFTSPIIRMKGQYFDRHEVIDRARTVLAELEKRND
jgi:DNA repair exonuclease SbcCD ATPase subunit